MLYNIRVCSSKKLIYGRAIEQAMIVHADGVICWNIRNMNLTNSGIC